MKPVDFVVFCDNFFFFNHIADREIAVVGNIASVDINVGNNNVDNIAFIVRTKFRLFGSHSKFPEIGQKITTSNLVYLRSFPSFIFVSH
jgi:hypothetical protein